MKIIHFKVGKWITDSTTAAVLLLWFGNTVPWQLRDAGASLAEGSVSLRCFMGKISIDSLNVDGKEVKHDLKSGKHIKDFYVKVWPCFSWSICQISVQWYHRWQCNSQKCSRSPDIVKGKMVTSVWSRCLIKTKDMKCELSPSSCIKMNDCCVCHPEFHSRHYFRSIFSSSLRRCFQIIQS